MLILLPRFQGDREDSALTLTPGDEDSDDDWGDWKDRKPEAMKEEPEPEEGADEEGALLATEGEEEQGLKVS